MNILLIDDEIDIRETLSRFLKKLGHTVLSATNGEEGLRIFYEKHFDLIITDLRMPGMDGLELLKKLKKTECSPVDVIVITGHGDTDDAIMALRYGAFDYIKKPIDVRELTVAVERSKSYAELRNNYCNLKENFEKRVEMESQAARWEVEHLRSAYLEEIGLDGILIHSDAMRKIIEQIEKYSADKQIPVLIEGETGTGKELMARYLHHFGSGSATNPFVAINCGGMAPELVEGELFGHEPGAYTGATKHGRIGKIEAAEGGSLFLDEIGEMPLHMQTSLLRILENKSFYRLGGVKDIPINIRFISATNKDLYQEIGTGRFRKDLFYRINMGTIFVPPLREHKDDIIPLALRFVSRAFKRRGEHFRSFSKPVEKFLLSYSWPGNVRELKNVMERVSIMNSSGSIEYDDIRFITEQNERLALSDKTEDPKDKKDIVQFEFPEEGIDLDKFTKEIILKALKTNNGNQTKTAQFLHISRRVLQSRMKKYFL